MSDRLGPNDETVQARTGEVEEFARRAEEQYHQARLSEPNLPQQIGRYHVLKQLGEGGMGMVYKAEQFSPIKQIVAIKVIRPGCVSGEFIARFESERRALELMDNPHIARVLDAGISETGQRYFVMEFVPGVPLTAFADAEKMTLTQRLDLFIQVCDAVAHAHSKALLHRDIKTHNVLGYPQDGKPCAKLIDFGIAKATGEDRIADVTLTAGTGHMIGSPGSMSPEQAEGSKDIDTRTDIFGLGALLYELLSGLPPIEPATIKGKSHTELVRLICDNEPVRPDVLLEQMLAGNPAKVEAIAARRGTRPQQLIRDLRRELQWIPMKALRRTRDRRYLSAQQMADDIRNYLANRPLVACPESKVYLARKFARRNLAALITAACITLAAVGGLVGYTIKVNAANARTLAEQQRTLAEQKRTEIANHGLAEFARFTTNVLGRASPFDEGVDAKVVDSIDSAVKLFDEFPPTTDPAQLADIEGRIGAVLSEVGKYADAERFLRDSLKHYAALADVPVDRLQTVYTDLGGVLLEVKDLSAAEDCYSRAIEFAQRLHPGDSPDAADNIKNIGLCWLKAEKPDAAETKLREAMAMLARLGMQDSELTALCLDGLGGVSEYVDDFAQAAAHFSDALTVRQAQSKPDEFRLADSFNNLGHMLGKQGKLDAAVKSLRSALQIYRRLSGNSKQTLNCLALLASTQREQKDYSQSETNYRLAIDGMSSRKTEMQDELHSAGSGLGRTLLAMGKPADAEPWLRDAYDYRMQFQRDANVVRPTADALVQVCETTGQHPKAVEIENDFEEAFRESLFPATQPAR